VLNDETIQLLLLKVKQTISHQLYQAAARQTRRLRCMCRFLASLTIIILLMLIFVVFMKILWLRWWQYEYSHWWLKLIFIQFIWNWT